MHTFQDRLSQQQHCQIQDPSWDQSEEEEEETMSNIDVQFCCSFNKIFTQEAMGILRQVAFPTTCTWDDLPKVILTKKKKKIRDNMNEVAILNSLPTLVLQVLHPKPLHYR